MDLNSKSFTVEDKDFLCGEESERVRVSWIQPLVTKMCQLLNLPGLFGIIDQINIEVIAILCLTRAMILFYNLILFMIKRHHNVVECLKR